MINLYSIPRWFFGYDIFLEIVFVIITLLVSIYAFKVYKLSGQPQSKLFGIAFFFISISYLLLSALNYIILTNLSDDICNALGIGSVTSLHDFGIYIHMLFFMVGLITLVYMTLKIKSPKTYSLLFVIILLFLLLNPNQLLLFNILASILLAYIIIHYVTNYLNKKNFKTLSVLLAFVFLLFGRIHFIFSVDNSVYYAIAHLVVLVAYLFILMNLVLVVKNEQKKRQASNHL